MNYFGNIQSREPSYMSVKLEFKPTSFTLQFNSDIIIKMIFKSLFSLYKMHPLSAALELDHVMVYFGHKHS